MTSDESSDERSDGTSDEPAGRSDWAKAGIVGALGFEIVAFIVIGLLGGQWLDRKLGTEPAGLLVGLLVSMVAAGVHVWKMVTRLMPSDDDAS